MLSHCSGFPDDARDISHVFFKKSTHISGEAVPTLTLTHCNSLTTNLCVASSIGRHAIPRMASGQKVNFRSCWPED